MNIVDLCKEFTAILGASARRRAVSLIEGVLYLVIALAVIIGGIVFFQQSQLSNAVTDTARAAVGISSQIRALYQNQITFGDNVDLTAAAVKSGAVPSNFIGGNTDDSIVHSFNGGAVAITGLGRGFVMTYTGISSPACQRMAVMDETGAGPMGIGMAGVTIGSAENFDISTGPSLTAPVSPEVVSAACFTGSEMAFFYSASTGGDFDNWMADSSGPDTAGGGSAGAGNGVSDRSNPWGYPFPTQRLTDVCGNNPGGSRPEESQVYLDCRQNWSVEQYGTLGGSIAEVCGTPTKPQEYHFPDGGYTYLERNEFTWDAMEVWHDCRNGVYTRDRYE
jgi:F0F1-type ATP synthase assembly protein I